MIGFIEWEDRFATNVSVVDTQHRELIRMINDLYGAMTANHGQAALRALVDRMATYAVTHFALEERYMTHTQYPGLIAHKAEHAAFRAKVDDVQQRLSKGALVLSLEIVTFLRDWLTHHILEVDRSFGPHLNAKGIY